MSSLIALQLAQHLDRRTKQRPRHLCPPQPPLAHLKLITVLVCNPCYKKDSSSLHWLVLNHLLRKIQCPIENVKLGNCFEISQAHEFFIWFKDIVLPLRPSCYLLPQLSHLLSQPLCWFLLPRGLWLTNHLSVCIIVSVADMLSIFTNLSIHIRTLARAHAHTHIHLFG